MDTLSRGYEPWLLSPLSRVVGLLPNGILMAYKWGGGHWPLTKWDDPPRDQCSNDSFVEKYTDTHIINGDNVVECIQQQQQQQQKKKVLQKWRRI